MERDLNKSRREGGESGWGTLASCGSQLESHSATVVGGSGKLMKADAVDDGLEENDIPRDSQPCRYLTAYLAAATWAGVAER